jgi:hypothetical protein
MLDHRARLRIAVGNVADLATLAWTVEAKRLLVRNCRKANRLGGKDYLEANYV